MKKCFNMTVRGLFLLALSVLLSMNISMRAEAEYVEDEINGIRYQNSVEMSVGYARSYSYGGGASISVYLSNSGDRVGNVKSSSGNLLVKKTGESYSTRTETDWETSQKTTTTSYNYTYLSFFAKKKGNYTVTFDVVKKDGSVRCTKAVQIKAGGSYTYVDPIKSIQYAGKDLYSYYPYTTKTSGVLKVALKKQYKLLSIEVGTHNKKGETIYKKVKNNKKISLAKKEVYSREYTYSTGGTNYQYDELFPTTYIRITYQDKKTKEKDTWITTLHTINKKQSW